MRTVKYKRIKSVLSSLDGLSPNSAVVIQKQDEEDTLYPCFPIYITDFQVLDSKNFRLEFNRLFSETKLLDLLRNEPTGLIRVLTTIEGNETLNYELLTSTAKDIKIITLTQLGVKLLSFEEAGFTFIILFTPKGVLPYANLLNSPSEKNDKPKSQTVLNSKELNELLVLTRLNLMGTLLNITTRDKGYILQNNLSVKDLYLNEFDTSSIDGNYFSIGNLTFTELNNKSIKNAYFKINEVFNNKIELSLDLGVGNSITLFYRM